MRLIFATQFADDSVAVTDAGDAPLRRRVAALDEDPGQLLREWLDEVGVIFRRSATNASARPKAAMRA